MVWDARTGAKLLTLDGHTGPVFSASYSPDGTRIVTASADWRYWASHLIIIHETRIFIAWRKGTAIVWDATNGRMLVRVP
jgi:hypothetical protein